MDPIRGRYVKHPRPWQSENIAPYRPAPNLGEPGALVMDEDGDIYVSREELERLAANGGCEWDLTGLIEEIDDAAAEGCFDPADPQTVLISIPYPSVARWLSDTLGRPLHDWKNDGPGNTL